MLAAATNAATVTTTVCRRCCTFLVGDSCFAVDAADVAEVLRGGALTRVPRAPAGIFGLLHLRGRMVPVVDLAGQLHITASRQADTHLVIRLQEDWYSLVVDEMLEVIEIPVDRIEQAAPTGEAPSREAISGVFAGETRLVYLIDPQRMIHSLVRQRTHTTGRHGALHDGQG